jgi:hypothetical protein
MLFQSVICMERQPALRESLRTQLVLMKSKRSRFNSSMCEIIRPWGTSS